MEAEDQLEDDTELAEVEEHILEHLPPRLNQGMIQRERSQAISLCCLVHFRGLLGMCWVLLVGGLGHT